MGRTYRDVGLKKSWSRTAKSQAACGLKNDWTLWWFGCNRDDYGDCKGLHHENGRSMFRRNVSFSPDYIASYFNRQKSTMSRQWGSQISKQSVFKVVWSIQPFNPRHTSVRSLLKGTLDLKGSPSRQWLEFKHEVSEGYKHNTNPFHIKTFLYDEACWQRKDNAG
jgi:hypothetical protein